MKDLSDIRFYLVDDNDIDISVNVKLLHLAKISEHLNTYSSATQFLTALREQPSLVSSGKHVVLLDIMMPGMDGFECLEELEKMDSSITNQLHVFMLSSSIDRSVISKAEKFAIVKRVLEKPLDVYLLKMALEDIFSD
ncbi:MAG: two-component system response regulator [Flavobacteriales bacterium]